MEIYKSVLGYEGIYEISNLGNVKSLSRTIFVEGRKPYILNERILKPGINTKGYYIVVLCNGKQKTRKVHQLVAIAFLNHTPCGMNLVVDHIDENKLNNKADNLQILTNRQNLSKGTPNKTSKYIGVSKNLRGKYSAAIQINGKDINLGSFDNEEDAREAYLDKLKKINIYTK